jgi:beta-lactamase regulating signal transducer with metallopeptidase domain
MLDSMLGFAASPVATLTWWGHELLRWLLSMNAWTGGLLVGALLLDRALASRARASWRLALYAPVGLRLLLPLSWKIPLAHTPRVVTLLTPRTDGFLPPDPAPVHAPAFTWLAALVLAYVAVALGLFFVRLRAYLALRRELLSARRLGEMTSTATAPCPVLEHEALGPMVVGTIRPRIVLPSVLLASDQAAALLCVLGHESAHVRRGDPWLMAVIQVLTVACWPVLPLWLAALRVRALVEMACDESALDDADAIARRRYGQALIDMAGWRTVTVSSLRAGELHFGSGLRARIEALANVRRWPRIVQAGLVATAVAGFAACSSVGSSEGTANAPGATPSAQSQGWTAPPQELRSEEDLATYCGPLLEFAETSPHYSQPRYRQSMPGGLPAEQVSFCTTPAVRDLVKARNWVAEARNALGQILKDTASYYEGTAVPSGRFQLCPSGGPVPKVMPAPDTKYTPKWPDDWNDGAGWECLRFGMDQPMWFQYEYVSDGQHVQATAHARRTNYLGEVIDVRLALHGDVVPFKDTRVLDVAPNIEEIWVRVP